MQPTRTKFCCSSIILFVWFIFLPLCGRCIQPVWRSDSFNCDWSPDDNDDDEENNTAAAPPPPRIETQRNKLEEEDTTTSEKKLLD